MGKRAEAAETATAWAPGSRHPPVTLFFDRDRVVPAAVKVLLQRDGLVCCASSASAAARQIAASTPDVAVLRISESSLEAAWLAKLIRKRAPKCRLVIVVDAPSEERTQAISGIGGDALLAGPLDIERLLEQAGTFLDEPGRARAGRPPWHGHVGRAIAYIVAHYNESLTVTTVARAVGLSRSRLACLFRASVGMTLKTYLVRFRLEVATRILAETEDKLETIAITVGFCDGPHLSRCFKKYLGHAPSRYRPSLGGGAPGTTGPARARPIPS